MQIKEMFNCTPPQKAKSSLEKWYSELLEKDESELTLNDICIMLRQSVFTDFAREKGMAVLSKDPYAGYCILGEVLYAFYENHKEFIVSNKDSFARIMEQARNIIQKPDEYSSEGFDGMSEEEFDDMRVLVSNIELLLDNTADMDIRDEDNTR